MKTYGHLLRSLAAFSFTICAFLAHSQEEGWYWQNPYLQGNDLNSIVMSGSIG